MLKILRFLRGSKFAVGDRVSVSMDYHWAQGATGIVEGKPRAVKTLSGTERHYWVSFDEAHIDADGDGPYQAAEIDGGALRRILASKR